MTADRPATEPRTDYSDPGVTIDQLLAEGWRPDGHRNIPHTLDEDECWCNESESDFSYFSQRSNQLNASSCISALN